MLGDFNTVLSTNNRSSKHTISKEMRALNDTLGQMDFTDIYRTLHPNATEYTFFSSAHGTFSKIDHILGHKSGLNRYQKTGIILCVFSDHNARFQVVLQSCGHQESVALAQIQTHRSMEQNREPRNGPPTLWSTHL